MIFLTVGTQFPFDRLVKAIDDAAAKGMLSEEIVAQTGESSYIPRNFKTVSFLEKDLFDKHIHEASRIISHVGMGIITAAIEYNKPLLVMPRRRKYGEVVSDHQVTTAQKFELAGHILVAYEVEELPKKIEQLKTFMPCKRNTQSQIVAERIAKFLIEVSSRKPAG